MLAAGVVDLHEAAAGDRGPHRGEPATSEPEEPDEVARRDGPSAAASSPTRSGCCARTRPHRSGWRDSVRYILSIPTNVLMIISSALGYFFFAGLSTFALLFVRGHYHASQATAELVLGLLVAGALVGTLVSGRVTDALCAAGSWRRGSGSRRSATWAPRCCSSPGSSAATSRRRLWFDIAGAALIVAANPPLDAARLDIMPVGPLGPGGEHAHRACARWPRRSRRCSSAGSPT